MDAHINLTGMAVVGLSALLCGMLMARLKQPALVGYIIAGVLLGPSAFGVVENREQIGGLAELGVRSWAGVATGDVFCGLCGSELRCEYSVVGDVVNLAARLMGKADGRGRGDVDRVGRGAPSAADVSARVRNRQQRLNGRNVWREVSLVDARQESERREELRCGRPVALQLYAFRQKN